MEIGYQSIPIFVVRQMTDERWQEITKLPPSEQIKIVGDLFIVDDRTTLLGKGLVIGEKVLFPVENGK